jgi:hypothetical protein
MGTPRAANPICPLDRLVGGGDVVSRTDRKIRYTRVMGVLFVIAGFAAIGGGWYGMIRQDQSVDRQFPYLISGGAAGIALLLFGVGLLVIAQIRQERRRLSSAVEGVLPVGSSAIGRLAVPAGSGGGMEPATFPGRYLRVLGLVVCAAGFVSIAFGWNGSARLTVVDQQFPFLLSGGVLGIALVALGVGILMVAQIQTERQKLSRMLEALAAVAVRRTGRVAAPEMHGADDGYVLAGPSTFHRFDCPLIKGRAGLDRVTVEEARSQGLAECRVCRPTAHDGKEPAREPVTEQVAVAKARAGRKGKPVADGSAQESIEAEDVAEPAASGRAG